MLGCVFCNSAVPPNKPWAFHADSRLAKQLCAKYTQLDPSRSKPLKQQRRVNEKERIFLWGFFYFFFYILLFWKNSPKCLALNKCHNEREQQRCTQPKSPAISFVSLLGGEKVAIGFFQRVD